MDAISTTQGWAWLGAALSVGIGGIGAAIGEGRTAAAAQQAVARQPAASATQLRTMLIGQAMAESSAVFALVVGLLLALTSWEGGAGRAGALLAAGLCMGLGAVGSGVGSGPPAAQAVEGMARNPRQHQPLTVLMLVGQGVAQTPAVFALLVSLLLMYAPEGPGSGFVRGTAFVAAGLCMGLGGIGPGIGAGLTAGAATEAAARHPENTGLILRTMVAGQAVAQSTAIYSLVVALLLLRFA